MTITAEIRQQRRRGIGGSDVAGILGISPYDTPLSIYDSKVSELPEEEPNDLYWYGNNGEDLVAKRICHDHGVDPKLLIEPSMITCKRSYGNGCHELLALANPDRVLFPDEGAVYAHTRNAWAWPAKVIAGYEIKWVQFNYEAWSKPGEKVKFPAHVYAQAFHYLWVVNRMKEEYNRVMGQGGDNDWSPAKLLDHWWVAACFGGRETRYYKVPWNEELAARHERVLTHFWWTHVVKGSPPRFTGRKVDAAVLDSIASAGSPANGRQPGSTSLHLMKEYRQLAKQIGELDLRRGEIRNHLRVMMRGAKKMRADTFIVSYAKPKTKPKVNYKAIVDALDVHPDMIAAHTTNPEPKRRLTITLKGEENE